MEMTQRESGLVVPKEPEKPKRKYGALEIVDEEMREECKEAFRVLWKAMRLHQGNGITLSDDPTVAVKEQHYRLFDFMEECLLGDDGIEHEVYC